MGFNKSLYFFLLDLILSLYFLRVTLKNSMEKEIFRRQEFVNSLFDKFAPLVVPLRLNCLFNTYDKLNSFEILEESLLVLIQIREPAFLFIGISFTNWSFYIFPYFFTNSGLIRDLIRQVELNWDFFEIVFDHLDSFFNGWVILINFRKIRVWIILCLINIVILSKSTHIIEYNMNSWM